MNNYLLLTSAGAWKALLNCELRAIDSYTLLKHYKTEVAPTIDAIQSANDSLIRKFGKEREGMVSVDPKSQDYKDFVTEQKELYNSETEVKPFAQTLESVIGNAGINSKLTGAHIELLEAFFAESKAKSKKAA